MQFRAAADTVEGTAFGFRLCSAAAVPPFCGGSKAGRGIRRPHFHYVVSDQTNCRGGAIRSGISQCRC
jgi:hypothetical protein